MIVGWHHGPKRLADMAAEMQALYWLGGAVTAALFIYLLVALVRAEDF